MITLKQSKFYLVLFLSWLLGFACGALHHNFGF